MAGGLTGVLGWAYWESTVATVRGGLEQWSLVAAMLKWLDSVGAGSLRSLLAPLIVVALSVPVVVVFTLLLVALAGHAGGGERMVARRAAFPGLRAARTAAAGGTGCCGRWPAPWRRWRRWC